MWKKILTISLIFAASVIGLIVLSVYAFERFNSYVNYTDAVNEHHFILEELNELRVQLIEVENNQRAFLLFNDSVFLDRYNTHVKNIKKDFSDVLEKVKDDAHQRKNLQELNILFRSRLDYLSTGILLGYPQTDHKKGTEYMDRIRATFLEMEAYQNTILKDQIKTKEFYQDTTPKNFKIIFLLTLIVFTVSFALLIQQYRDRRLYQQQLEASIIELNQINSELEQIAHVASHDLQEPLRKIRTFSDILQSRYQEHIDDESLMVVKRIETASARAQSLMTDIVNYTSIVKRREAPTEIDLNLTLGELILELQERMRNESAVIYYNNLPTIKGLPDQIRLLFTSLIDNSLKFRKSEEGVKVTISALEVPASSLPVKTPLDVPYFYKINVEDNGIGFENQFSEKIFKIFQRLHPQDSVYEGRGIGLAMVKRIMTNHLGYVVARGRPGKGAIFSLYFPKQSN